MTKREAVLMVVFFGLLVLTAAAFTWVEDRVDKHGFDTAGISVAVVFGVIFMVGVLKLSRIGRLERTVNQGASDNKLECQLPSCKP